MKKEYISIVLNINEEDYDIASSVLEDYSFTGIEEKYDELIITFDKQDFNESLTDSIINSLKEYNIEVELNSIISVNDKNWNEEYEKQSKPIIVNSRIAISPTWKSDEITSEIKILINPKMSFGTGEHSTTRLVCRLMDGIVKQGSEWIDIGTGTGVLAILGVKLGAKSFLAFDNNEWSVSNAIENAQINKVEESIKIIQSDIDSIKLQQYDGIVANLFLHLVKNNFDKFYNALKNNNSDLIISGIMSYDKDIIIENAQDNNFQLINSIIEDEWIAFHFKPLGKI